MNTTQQKDNKMNIDTWCELYLNPVVDVANGAAEPTSAMEDGFAGFILDGILAIKDVEDDTVNDWEIVELVSTLCENAMAIQERF